MIIQVIHALWLSSCVLQELWGTFSSCMKGVQPAGFIFVCNSLQNLGLLAFSRPSSSLLEFLSQYKYSVDYFNALLTCHIRFYECYVNLFNLHLINIHLYFTEGIIFTLLRYVARYIVMNQCNSKRWIVEIIFILQYYTLI